jgi:hypothetical protein
MAAQGGSRGSDVALAHRLNQCLAALCSELMNVEGPPAPAGVTAADARPDQDDDIVLDDELAEAACTSPQGDGGSGLSSDVSNGVSTGGGQTTKSTASAPLAPLACELAAAHVRRLTAAAAAALLPNTSNAAATAAAALLYDFYGAVASAPRFMAVAAAAVRGAGWACEDVAAEEAAEEAAALVAAAAAEGNSAAAAAAAAATDAAAATRRDQGDDKEESSEWAGSEERRSGGGGGSAGFGDVLISALAAATLAGLRSTDPARRAGAARSLAAALARHAWDSRLQSPVARAAVAAVHAPLLRLVITHRNEIIPALPPGNTKPNTLYPKP